MTLEEFEREVYDTTTASSICGIPVVRRQTPSFLNLRVPIGMDQFIDAFFNEVTGTVAFAPVESERRIFGADNTGDWHLHPFEDPSRHDPLPSAMSFREFVAAVEEHLH